MSAEHVSAEDGGNALMAGIYSFLYLTLFFLVVCFQLVDHNLYPSSDGVLDSVVESLGMGMVEIPLLFGCIMCCALAFFCAFPFIRPDSVDGPM